MTNLFDTLQRLITSFVASDIMVPKDQIISAENEDKALQLFDQNPQYDVIPLHREGRLVAFLERGSVRTKSIQIQDVVSAGTPILDQAWPVTMEVQRPASYISMMRLSIWTTPG